MGLKEEFQSLMSAEIFSGRVLWRGGCGGGGGGGSGGGHLQYLSSVKRFIVWAEFLSAALLQKRKRKKHQSLAFSDPRWSNLHPSHLGDVLYRTFARKVPRVLLELQVLHPPKNVASSSSSIGRVCSRGVRVPPLALQAANQSLNALQLVHRVLDGGLGGRCSPARASRSLVVLEGRAALPATRLGGLGAGLEAAW